MNEPLQRELLMRRLEGWEPGYDPELGLLRVPFNSPGYHTTLKDREYAYATYPNMIYAVALLDSKLPQLEERAFDIIGKVISLQETDPEKDTYGIWPWFYEEPLSRMSPPDWNWADFIGKLLLQAASRHRSRLPEQLAEEIRSAVFRACDAIIKRDVGPWYTNIAIMGAFVTVLAGELYGRSDYLEYGLHRLDRFRTFTRRLGTFQEYNSPAYALITILELSKLRSETGNEQARSVCTEMLDVVWKMVAEHFHAGTKQWSGPHSRSYSTLLKPEAASFLQLATDGTVHYMPWEELVYSPEWYLSGIRCPEQYLGYFRSTEETRTVHEMFFRDGKKGFEKWAYAYITPQYTLGSFSREIMWNQCRSLVSYIGSGGSAVYIHLRVLKDGYDYCSALLTGKQLEGTVLGALQFFTNGGDTHPVLDKKDGAFEAEDLRIRFEIGGAVDGVECRQVSQEKVELSAGGIRTQFSLLYGVFQDGEDGASAEVLHWDVAKRNGLWCSDLVIHAGEKRFFDFNRIRKAAVVFAVSMDGAEEAWDVKVACGEGGIETVSAAGRGRWSELSVDIPVRPGEV